MSKTKNVRYVLDPPPFHMVGNGFRVHNFFPRLREIGLTGMSPFFLLDYNSKWQVTPSETPRGVGVHPHRGIETVTISFSGKVAHHDSAGNSGIIDEGDVQWMTAGGAVLHKEYHEKEFSRKGGLFHMAQIWVNLPAEFKRTPAKYQSITNAQMGKLDLPGDKGTIDVIAGEYKGVKGPASTFSPINMYYARLKKDSSFDISFPALYNTGILVAEGNITVNETREVPSDRFVLFAHDGEQITISSNSDSKLVILSGLPIDEPVAAYGPFVMNTDEEIKEAYEDYYAGKFGYLED